MTRRPSSDRGSVSLEVAILAPGLLLLLGALILAGRLTVTATGIEHAAAVAARDASLARTADAARSAALAAAERELTGSGVTCSPGSTLVDTAGFSAPLGEVGVVSVTVTCTVSMTDLNLPALPAARTLTGTATSPLDAYRGRGA